MLIFNLLLGLSRKSLLYKKQNLDLILGLCGVLFWASCSNPAVTYMLERLQTKRHRKKGFFIEQLIDSEIWEHKHSFWSPWTILTTEMQPWSLAHLLNLCASLILSCSKTPGVISGWHWSPLGASLEWYCRFCRREVTILGFFLIT